MAAWETSDDADTAAGMDWPSLITGEWTTGGSSGGGSILHQGAVWTTDSHYDSGESGESDRLSHSSSPSSDSQYGSIPSSDSQYSPSRSTDWSYCALTDLDSCHGPIGFSPYTVCNEPPSSNGNGLEESLLTSSSMDDFDPALHGNLDDNSTVVSSTLFSPSATSADNMSSRRASAAKKKRKWVKKKQKNRPQSDLLYFETAYELLIGDSTTKYPHRPYRVRAMPARQIFIERPPAKRQWGGDKWRNSGGKQGGVLVWVKPHSGVRKRYGVLFPEDGGQKLKFQQFSLVSRESASPTAPVFEDPSVYMYVVEPCEPCTINGEDSSKRSASAKQPLTTTSRTALAAPQQDVLPSTLSGSRQTAVKCERKPSSSSVDKATVSDKPTVLDFKDVAFRGLARAKRSRSASPDKLHSPLNRSRPHSHGSQRPYAWPFGKATLTAVSSLLLVSVVLYVGLLQQRPVEVAGDSKCQMGTFRPPHQLLPDCLRCTVCSAHAQVTLRACTAESDTVCGSWGWTRSVADVHIIPPPLTAPGVATDISQKPSVQNGAKNMQVAQRQHVPQFPATWTSQGVLYSFGGSGDTAAASTAEPRLRAAGERCVTQATGITDELWTYQRAGGWNQVAAPSEGEGRGPREVVWPRRRYAATSWGLDDGRGAVFSGDFEFCHNQDYSVPERENLVFVAPDSLYVYNAGGDSEAGDESGWSLLGGSDKWYPLTQTELNQALGVGFLADTYFCSGSRICSWPLPRARGQGWFLSGRAYLFSGMLSVVDQDFNNLRTQTFLLNDFWSFDPTDMEDHPSNAGGDGAAGSNGGGMPLSQRVAMSRIAACGEYVDAPDVLPADGGPYPGGRFSAALWTNTRADDRHDKLGVGAKAAISRGGWMFGGIGRRSPGKMSGDRTRAFVVSHEEYTRPTDTLGVGSYAGSECVVDSIIGAGEWYPVRNLCDLWIFVPGKGFRLVSACENDAADLSVFNGPVPMVQLSDGPTAGIFATTWVTRNDGHLKLLDSSVHSKGDEGAAGGTSSLWMFGGITSCAPFNGVSADGQNASDPLIMGALMDLPKSHAKDACDQPGIDDPWMCHETELRGFWLENMTMCDMSLPGHGIAVVGMGSGHPSHQPCTQDLWRFDLLTETWEHMRDLAGGNGDHDGWPEARCGALSFSSSPPSSSTTQQSSVSFVGGWGGPSSGECEEWPQANSSCAVLLNETRRSDGCQHVLQSFRSKDLPTLPIRHSRAYPATCRPLAEVWNFELRASRS